MVVSLNAKLESIFITKAAEALLAFPHDIDYCADVISLRALLEFLHRHLAAIWNLLLVVEENLLADDFRSEETQVLVSEHILVIPWRSHREPADNRIEDIVQIELLLSGSRIDDGLRKLFLPPLHELMDLLLGADVYLVDNQHYRTFNMLEFCDVLRMLVAFLDGVCHVKHDFNVLANQVNRLIQRGF